MVIIGMFFIFIVSRIDFIFVIVCLRVLSVKSLAISGTS